MIICYELFNMGRIGNFFIFMPHFDNVPELSRLYTFSTVFDLISGLPGYVILGPKNRPN